jgi:hypothetical protein
VFRLEPTLKVYLHREPVDFRLSINGLALRVEKELGLDPFAPCVYVCFGADAGLSHSVAVCRRPREPARMSRDLYGSWASDLMRWLTGASARWLISVPAPTRKGSWGILCRRGAYSSSPDSKCFLLWTK